MRIDTKKYFVVLSVVLAAVLLVWTAGLAGDLEPTAAPDNATSAMYTLEDLYNRLETGAAGSKRTGGVVEPDIALSSTGHTIDEIMSKMPVKSSTPAGPDDVKKGLEFWSLDNSTDKWGLSVGTYDDGSGQALSCSWPCADLGNGVCEFDSENCRSRCLVFAAEREFCDKCGIFNANCDDYGVCICTP